MNEIPEGMKLEVELARALGVDRRHFQRWRENGELIEGQTWFYHGREIVINHAGETKIRQLLELGAADEFEEDTLGVKIATIQVKVARKQGLNPRRLRVILPDQSRGTVKLITERVFTQQFVPGVMIEVTPTEDGLYEYHSKAPKRVRL